MDIFAIIVYRLPRWCFHSASRQKCKGKTSQHTSFLDGDTVAVEEKINKNANTGDELDILRYVKHPGK